MPQSLSDALRETRDQGQSSTLSDALAEIRGVAPTQASPEEDLNAFQLYTKGLIGRSGETIESLTSLPGLARDALTPNMEAIANPVKTYIDAAKAIPDYVRGVPGFFKNYAVDAAGGGEEVGGMERAGRLTSDALALVGGVKGISMAKRLAGGARIVPSTSASVAPQVTSTAFGSSGLIPGSETATLGRAAVRSPALQQASQQADDVLAVSGKARRVPPQKFSRGRSHRGFVGKDAPVGQNTAAAEINQSINNPTSSALRGALQQADDVLSTPVKSRIVPSLGFSRGRTHTGFTAKDAPVKPFDPQVNKPPTPSQPGTLPVASKAPVAGPEARAVVGAKNPAYTPKDPALAAKEIEELTSLRTTYGGQEGARVAGMDEAMFRRLTGGKRSAKPSKVIERIEDSALKQRLSDDAGFAHGTLMGKIAAGGTGAAIGATMGETPEEQWGGAIALGLVGVGGVKSVEAFLRFATRHPEMAKDVVQGISTIRVEAALSGLAVPKNVANAIGAPLTAAWEKSSTLPLKTAFLEPRKNLAAFGRGFKLKGQAADIGVTGERQASRLGFFGRMISGVDNQAMEAMQRAGMTKADIDRLLVRRPLTEFMTKEQAESMAHGFQKQLVLFQRTPMNVFGGGMQEFANATGGAAAVGRKAFGRSNLAASPSELARRRALTLATPVGGLGVGAAAEGIDNDYVKLLVMGLAAAANGVRTIPFAFGAAAGSQLAGGTGQEALLGTAPFPDFGFDLFKAFTGMAEPSGARVIKGLTKKPKGHGRGRGRSGGRGR